MSKVLVLAVHPDDETLGCGGTLLKHKEQGDNIFWLIGTSLEQDGVSSSADLEKREKDIEKDGLDPGYAPP